MKQIQLRGQEDPITLEKVVQDDEMIVGITRSGKRFVTLPDRLQDSLPVRHPYRVYLRGGAGFRAIDPSFEDAHEWLVYGDDAMDFILPDGREIKIERSDVLSLLSATPEDEANAVASNN